MAADGPTTGPVVVTLASGNPSQAPYRFHGDPLEIMFDSTARDLANRMRNAHVGPPIKLALEEISATEPPGYLLEVFMGVKGSDPSLRTANLLGYLSVYDLHQKLLLFDVTEVVGTLLATRGDLSLVVTVRPPEATDSQASSDSAEILIGRARIVAQ